jgi:hypothetical protein
MKSKYWNIQRNSQSLKGFEQLLHNFVQSLWIFDEITEAVRQTINSQGISSVKQTKAATLIEF